MCSDSRRNEARLSRAGLHVHLLAQTISGGRGRARRAMLTLGQFNSALALKFPTTEGLP
jgi:hypothetical protein